MSTWTYQGKPVEHIDSDYEGFVYLITNTVDHKMYVGKKLAKFKTTKPPLKGRKNKRRGHKESDWRDYWGSPEKYYICARVVAKCHILKHENSLNAECWKQIRTTTA